MTDDRIVDGLVSHLAPFVDHAFEGGVPWWYVAMDADQMLERKALELIAATPKPRRRAVGRHLRDRIHPRVRDEIKAMFRRDFPQ